MTPLQIGLIGGVIGIILTAVFDRWWFRRKLRKLAAGIGHLFQGVASQVPPFRIGLDLVDDAEWEYRPVVKRTTKELKRLGYQVAGDFVVAQFDNRYLRGFVNPDVGTYLALYENTDIERVVVEITSHLADDTFITTTNAPYDGLTRPDFAPLTGIQVDLNANPISVIEVHEALLARRGNRQGKPFSPNEFDEVYTSTYSRIIDWRVDRGTLTADEVRRISEHTGEDPPDEAHIAKVQAAWRDAIDNFLNLRIQDRFLNMKVMPEEEWAAKRERIVFVHERMDQEAMKETLGWHIVDKDAHVDQDQFGESSDEASQKLRGALSKLKPAFADIASFRVGFKNAQPLLPENRRYNFICKVAGDYPADVYLAPEKESDYDEEDDE